MKRIILIFSMAIAGMALHAADAKQQSNFVEENVNAQRFTISVRQAIPLQGPSVSLTSDYSLKLSGDTVTSYLPYYGQAYSVPYGGGQGLNFKGTATDYTVRKNKKGEITVEFKVRSEDDQLKYIISLFPEGNATIKVMPNNRSPIDFYGEMNNPD